MGGLFGGKSKPQQPAYTQPAEKNVRRISKTYHGPSEAQRQAQLMSVSATDDERREGLGSADTALGPTGGE